MLIDLERKIRKELIKVAKDEQVIKYGELADKVNYLYNCHYGADEKAFHDMLGNISKYEYQSKPPRPLLSVIVVTKNQFTGTLLPGHGFFTLAKELGKQRPDVDDDTFAMQEMNKLFDYWNNNVDPDV